jgi:hypothetical protein
MSSVAGEVNRYPVTGVVPPEAGEAIIRVTYPAITAYPAVASLGRSLILSYLGAPLGWAVMLPFYFLKVLPVAGKRYALTNRRIMILKGWAQAALPYMKRSSVTPSQEVKLADIDEVRVVHDANSDFFRAATLEIVSGGQVKMRLPGTPEAEAFRLAILNARRAWAPRESDRKAFIPASATTAS